MMILLMALLAQDSWIPSDPGTAWTLRDTVDGKSTEHTLRIATLPAGELELVLRAEDKDRTLAGPAAVGVFDGDRLTAIHDTTADDVRLFDSMAGKWHTIDLLFPRNLKDGATWTSPHTWLSRGFATVEMSCTATAEKVVVPAGTFDAIRIDAVEGKAKRSLWVVRGVGVVKRVWGSMTSELVSIEKPTDAAKRLAALLAKDSVEERGRAAGLLRDIGIPALPALRDAERSANAQVRDHAAAILKEMPIRFQWTGCDSKVKEEAVEVVRDADAWAKSWKRHSDAAVPPVDFARHQAVAIFHGLDSGPGGQKEAYRVTGLDLSAAQPVLTVIRKPRLFSGRFNALHGFAIVLIDRGLAEFTVVRTSSNNFEPKDVVERIYTHK